MSLNLDPSTWRLRTLGGIPYKLYQDNPKGHFEEESADITEQYIIQASDLADFVVESFSDTIVWPGIAWFYRPPRRYPGLFYLVTKSLDFESFPPGKPGDPYAIDSSAESGTYSEFLLVTIKYSSGKSEEDTNNDIVELSVNASGEYLTHFPKRAKYNISVADNPSTKTKDEKLTNPLVPMSKIVPSLEWNLKFRRIPRVNMAASFLLARSLLGTVNNYAMPAIFDAPPETILFAGFSMATKWTWREKDPSFELDMKLLEKQINEQGEIKGHNHVFNPNTGRWDRLVKTDSSGVALDPPSYAYELANLNQLFYG